MRQVLKPEMMAFFCTYIVLVAWVLLPVVVAVLLDNFTMATKMDMEVQEQAKVASSRQRMVTDWAEV